MPTKLKNLKITAVALCKQGANPDAHIMLYKSIDPKGGEQMDFEQLMKSLNPEQQALINAEIEKAKKPPVDMEDLLDGGADDATENPDGTPKEKAKGNKCAKALVKSLQAEVATLTANVNKSEAEKEDEVFKSLPAPMQKYITDLKAQTEASAAVAKALAEEKVTKAFEEQASVFKSIPSDAKTMGGILKAVTAVDANLGTSLGGIFKATNELIEKGKIVETVIGKNDHTTVSNTASEELQKKADELVVKTAGMTKEQAFTKACIENPALYTKYVAQLNADGE